MTRQGLLGALASLVIGTVLILTLLPIVSASTTADQAGVSATAEVDYQATQATPSTTKSPNWGISSAPPLLLLVA
ncbi:MAG: hypothetical protein Q8R28_05695, partial [Dehalococcoidia bacterium]|nr:hypothetical protein [Dehalococcoidia bacterium]